MATGKVNFDAPSLVERAMHLAHLPDEAFRQTGLLLCHGSHIRIRLWL